MARIAVAVGDLNQKKSAGANRTANADPSARLRRLDSSRNNATVLLSNLGANFVSHLLSSENWLL